MEMLHFGFLLSWSASHYPLTSVLQSGRRMDSALHPCGFLSLSWWYMCCFEKTELSGGLGEKVAEVLDSAFWLASQSFLVCPRWGLLQVNFKNSCAQPPPSWPDKLRIFCLRQPVRGSSRSQTAKVDMTTTLAVSDAKCRKQQSKPPSQLRW